MFRDRRRSVGESHIPANLMYKTTGKKRLAAKLKAIKMQLERRRHEPIAFVGEWLRKVTSGYYQYHAVPGNLPRLTFFRWRLRWVWWRALSRRSQRSRVPMDRLYRLLAKWIPVPRVLHPYPMQLDPGSGTYQVHGRIVVGQNGDGDFTFAPLQQTCNLGLLAPSKAIP